MVNLMFKPAVGFLNHLQFDQLYADSSNIHHLNSILRPWGAGGVYKGLDLKYCEALSLSVDPK